MRLALHFCDDSEEARQERRGAGKQFVECESFDKILDYFENTLIGLDVISETATLGKNSDKYMGYETASVYYRSHTPRNNINYMNLGFSLSEVVVEDSWLAKFMPSVTESSKFLKLKDKYYNHKPFLSDGMNGYG